MTDGKEVCASTDVLRDNEAREWLGSNGARAVEVARAAWTKERPTEPGYYWCRSPLYHLTVVRVTRDGDGSLAVCDTGGRIGDVPRGLWPLADVSESCEWLRVEPPQ